MSDPTPHPRNSPTGFRRLTPCLLQADRIADRFDGLPDGVKNHGQLLAALKAATPRIGLSSRLIQTIDWLFSFTRSQDWEPGARPIVWPSASMQQEALCLAESRVKVINRGLIDAGLITMKDSPNGKRYGRRDHQGRIVEAYGFDLSPLASRYAEFVQLAAETKAERKLIGGLRRRATVARRAIAQILETASDYGFDGDDWPQLRHDVQALIRSLRQTERPEEIAIGVGSLERRQTEARTRLEQLLEGVDSGPKGLENRPHNIPTNETTYPEKDTVVAHEGERSPAEPDLSEPVSHNGREEKDKAAPRSEREGTIGSAPGQDSAQKAGQEDTQGQNIPSPRPDDASVIRLSTDELVRMAPRLRIYLKSPRPVWPEIVDAADWLRGELGVSTSLWGEACIAMGRQQAAIAIAIVSTKPAEHFRSTPGGYFYGMVAKAKAGELSLARTVWGLRQTATSRTRGNQNATRPKGRPPA
jgi:replication initiation protein RepC